MRTLLPGFRNAANRFASTASGVTAGASLRLPTRKIWCRRRWSALQKPRSHHSPPRPTPGAPRARRSAGTSPSCSRSDPRQPVDILRLGVEQLDSADVMGNLPTPSATIACGVSAAAQPLVARFTHIGGLRRQNHRDKQGVGTQAIRLVRGQPAGNIRRYGQASSCAGSAFWPWVRVRRGKKESSGPRPDCPNSDPVQFARLAWIRRPT